MIKKKMNQKGSLAYAMVFFMLALTLIFFFALIIPMLIDINTEMYAVAGNKLLPNALAAANTIQDANVRTAMLNSINNANDSVTTNTDILSGFFQYGWLIVIFVIVVVMFILARRSVEYGGIA